MVKRAALVLLPPRTIAHDRQMRALLDYAAEQHWMVESVVVGDPLAATGLVPDFAQVVVVCFASETTHAAEVETVRRGGDFRYIREPVRSQPRMRGDLAPVIARLAARGFTASEIAEILDTSEQIVIEQCLLLGIGVGVTRSPRRAVARHPGKIPAAERR